MYCDLEELRGPFLEWIKADDFDIHRWSRDAMGELYPLWMLKYLPNMRLANSRQALQETRLAAQHKLRG